jgi:hypothetical protein
MLGWRRKSNLLVDRMALTPVGARLAPQRAPGARLVILPGCEAECRRKRGREQLRGATRQARQGHLADPRSDPKSPTGPRRVSLSGLTIALMLVT